MIANWNVVGFPDHSFMVGGTLDNRKFHAWFKHDSTMADAERIDKLNRSYNVKRGTKLWNDIQEGTKFLLTVPCVKKEIDERIDIAVKYLMSYKK